jgi:hypothetical protein
MPQSRIPNPALRASAGLGVLALATILQWVYRVIVWPKYDYLGYSYRRPEAWGYGIALAIAVAVAVTLPTHIRRPSHLIIWVVYVVAGMPSIVVPHYIGQLAPGEALSISAQVGVASLLINAIGGRGAFGRLLPRHISHPFGFWMCILTFTAIVYAYMAANIGLGLRVPSLTDVYDVRLEYRSELTAVGLLGYLLPIQANIVNPVIMLRGIYSRQPWWVVGGFFGQVAIFSASGLKSVILSTPAVILFAVLFMRNKRPVGANVIWGAVVGALAATGFDRLTGGDAWTSIGVRRFLLTPGLLTGAYFHIFNPLAKAHWAYSFLSPILHYPYSVSPSFLVGRLYFSRPELNANASIFADGFANWGFAGLFVETFVLIVALWAVDSASRGMPVAVSALVFTVPAIALANSSVFTTLLTHGLGAGIVLCLFAPRTGWARRTPRRDPVRPAMESPRKL